jgi:hypothetical protein
MPKVKGEARGLRSMHCITTPATANPAPAAIAPTIRTIRMFQMVPPAPEVSKVKRYFTTSPNGILIGPFCAAIIMQTISTLNPAIKNRRFRFTKPL